MPDTSNFLIIVFASVFAIYKIFSDRLYIDKLERLLEQTQTKNEELNTENNELAQAIAALESNVVDSFSDRAN